MSPSTFVDSLSQPLQERLRAIGTTQQFADADQVIGRGEVTTHLYVVEEGQLLAQTRDASVPVTSGEVVGEMAFLDNRPRTATVVARGPVRLRVIDREPCFQAFSDQPLLLNELISALSALQRHRLQRDAETDQRSTTQLVDDLTVAALQHRAVRHPYLEALAKGSLPDPRFALEDFARHYYGYSAHFPRYLTALISRLEDPAHRRALLENLTEESGVYEQEELDELAGIGIQPDWIVGIPHPELFQRFRKALGVANTAVQDDHIEVLCWREMFLAILTNGSPAEAVGALGLGTETIVQTLYQPFVKAINGLGTIHARDAVFFPLHTAVDDHHQATLKEVAAAYAQEPQGRADLAKGMVKALSLRDAFWNWLHQRALDPEGSRPSVAATDP